MKLFNKTLFFQLREVFIKRTSNETFWAYIFISIPLGWSTIFFLLPIIKSINYSFTDFALSKMTSEWVGLENYIDVLMSPFWWHTIWISFKYSLAVVPAHILISLLLASLIIKFKNKVQSFFKAAFYLPTVLSLVVFTAIIKWIFEPGSGFANTLIQNLGFEPQLWFASPDQAFWVLAGMTWISGHGLGILLYCAALSGIPDSIYEASELDGVRPFRKFTRITWPLVRPTTIYVSILGLIGTFQVFDAAFLITRGGPLNTTYFVNYNIYNTFYNQGLFGVASAMSVILMIIILTVSILNYSLLSSKVEY